MDKPKGGRGHTVPYETKQMRIPEAMEPQIQELIARYRSWITESGRQVIGFNNPPRLLDKNVDKFQESGHKRVDNFNLEEIGRLNKLVDNLKEGLEEERSQSKHYHILWEGLAAQKAEWERELRKEGEIERENAALHARVGDLDLALTNCKEELEHLRSGLRPMRLRELAERLGQKSHSQVSKIKSSTGFSDWSKDKDPEGVAWRYDAESKLFYPVK